MIGVALAAMPHKLSEASETCFGDLLLCSFASHPAVSLFSISLSLCLLSQGTLIGLYADKRYKSGEDDKKALPLQSIEIIGGEVYGNPMKIFSENLRVGAAVVRRIVRFFIPRCFMAHLKCCRRNLLLLTQRRRSHPG